eukprot:5117919-Pyramimonas_sp.AAC.1
MDSPGQGVDSPVQGVYSQGQGVDSPGQGVDSPGQGVDSPGQGAGRSSRFQKKRRKPRWVECVGCFANDSRFAPASSFDSNGAPNGRATFDSCPGSITTNMLST